MGNNDYFYAPEVNDLSKQGALHKRKSQYKRKKQSNDESSSNSSSGSSSGSGASPVSAAFSVVVSVVVVALVAVTVTELLGTVPKLHVADWQISCHSIGFSFSADSSDTPYVISLELLDERVQSFQVDEKERAIEFDGLSPSTEYEVVIENDWGEGFQQMIDYRLVTPDLPTFPNGRLFISGHVIDEAQKTLMLTLTADDPYHYLSDFRLEASDKTRLVNVAIPDIGVPIFIDIRQFAKGFIDITVYGKSSHPTIGGREVIITTYEIYY